MEQEKKSPENQGDFFDQLMFGKPRSQSENTEEPSSNSSDNEETTNQQETNQEKSQIEYIMEIAQVVGPYLSKLSPMLSNLQSFFSNKK
ncbi:hypothetical protein BTR23_06620 [Alkalihalophilus pseudofirmus]|nr:hypothetical protein BTR23_06620 [Alkalihalophilus pseudofirmus]